MDIEHVDLSAVLKRLCLATVARVYPEFEQRAAIEGWTHREFLIQLLSQEVAHRAETRVKKLTSGAHFPYLKTIEEFDFTFQNSIRRQQLGPFLGPEFVTEGRNLISKEDQAEVRLTLPSPWPTEPSRMALSHALSPRHHSLMSWLPHSPWHFHGQCGRE